MKSILALFTAFVLSLSISCAAPMSKLNSGEKMVAQSSKLVTDAPQYDRRARNRSIVQSFKDRTYIVVKDCTPKKGVVVLGTRKPDKALDGHGTGVVLRSYEDRSYIATAAHVVEINAHYKKGYTCEFFVQPTELVGTDKGKLKATVLISNEARDLAVLKVPKDLGVQSEMELDAFPGEDVWAVGFPMQFLNTEQEVLSITKGTLATMNVDAGRSGKFHRVTSQVYFGNSGGGIWNKSGKLVGIVVALIGAEGDYGSIPYEGYYYIKPIEELLMLLKHEGVYWEVFSMAN